jgi:hypothetical protein
MALLGFPPGDAKALIYDRISNGRTPAETMDFVMDSVQHNTHKSGALLGAQGIFVVVCTYALDHGWPRPVALAALFLLIAGSLLIISTLKSTGVAFQAEPEVFNMRVIDLLLSRVVRYNIALYMTFGSLILLAAGAVTLIG